MEQQIINQINEKNIKFKISQFEQFYYLLMKNSPEGYKPWFFPCEKNGKNPCPSAIIKINPESKGSWHHDSARLSKEQVIENIKQGYNIGISAKKDDPLIIGDIDEPKYMDQIPKNTLTTNSRKRCTGHFFGWDKDGTAKINLPTDYGEMRSNNQYVITPGSYVPFNLEIEKEKKSFEKLLDSAKKDELIGYYTVKESISPRELAFEDLPEFFKEKEKENIEIETNIKQDDKKNEFKGGGKYSDLFKLKVSDIVGLIPSSKRKGHPLHESETDANFSLSKDGSIAHCWRDLVSLNAVQFLCVKAGYSKCEDAGTPHKVDGKHRDGRRFSKIRGDKKAFEVAYQEAVKMGLIKEYKEKLEEQNDEELRELFMAIGQAKKFISKQPIYYERKGQFWAWDYNNYCWVEKDETDILNLVRKTSYLDTITSKHKTEILEAIKQVGRDNKPEDIKPSWIQFKDKIYDIENNSNLPSTPKYFVVNPINWKIGETEESPTIDKLINSWVLPEDVPKLYEFFAFCIVPKYFIHSFIFLYGPPGTGKSTFVNLLIKFIGQHNCVATSIDRINKNSRFETKNWYKKLLITQSEVSNVDDLKNSAMINQATGEDPIAAEIKGGENFSFINYGKFIYPTNKFLKVDEDDGFGRRVRTVKFLNRFEKEKDVLEKIPDYEFENLAKKCLRIAHELWIKRTFTGDVNISERMKKYQEISKTPLELFINQHCDISDFNAKTLFDEFYAKYIKITQKDDTKIKVSKELRKLGFEIKLENWKEDNIQQTLYQDNMSKNYEKDTFWVSGRRISGITLK